MFLENVCHNWMNASTLDVRIWHTLIDLIEITSAIVSSLKCFVIRQKSEILNGITNTSDDMLKMSAG